jgi:hypothetical protein
MLNSKSIAETGGQFVGYFGIITSTLILLGSTLMLTKIFTEWDLFEETLHSISRLEKDKNLQDPAGMEMFKHCTTQKGNFYSSLTDLLYLFSAHRCPGFVHSRQLDFNHDLHSAGQRNQNPSRAPSQTQRHSLRHAHGALANLALRTSHALIARHLRL